MTLRQEMAARWNAAALVLMGVPVFVWSPFLVEFFGVRLRWFPISGSESGSGLFLPVLVLCCASTPLLFRQMQARFREIQGQDFLRVAYAKGLTRQSVFWRHELPVAFVAFLPYWFSHLSGLLAGSIVIEHIFDWPGMGHLLFESFQNRDYPMIQGILVFSTLLQVLNSALSDFLVQRLDPRVQWSASL
jgi:peptide/nickel transport system permease protein